MPNKSCLNDLLAKVLGYPSLIRRIQSPVILRMLRLNERESVLDVGCGSGYFTSEISKRSRLSVGVDLKVNQRLGHALSKQSGKIYLIADVNHLPFVGERFDKILLSSVLQVVKDDAVLIEECRRILRMQGVLVLSVPTDYCYFKKLNGLRSQIAKKSEVKGKGYYKPEAVLSLLTGMGFRILECEYSPKKLGSVVCELETNLWIQYNVPFLSSICFPLFYPLLYLEKRANKKQVGNELLVKVQKISRLDDLLKQRKSETDFA